MAENNTTNPASERSQEKKGRKGSNVVRGASSQLGGSSHAGSQSAPEGDIDLTRAPPPIMIKQAHVHWVSVTCPWEAELLNPLPVATDEQKVADLT